MTCHFIEQCKKLKILKISFEYIWDKWFEIMGETLKAMGSKVKVLHITSNGHIEDNCLKFSTVTSISSENYHQIIKPTNE